MPSNSYLDFGYTLRFGNIKATQTRKYRCGNCEDRFRLIFHFDTRRKTDLDISLIKFLLTRRIKAKLVLIIIINDKLTKIVIQRRFILVIIWINANAIVGLL